MLCLGSQGPGYLKARLLSMLVLARGSGCQSLASAERAAQEVGVWLQG